MKSGIFHKRGVFWAILLLAALMLVACAPAAPEAQPTVQTQMEGVQLITAQKAKEIMDGGGSAVIVDVRTREEYDQGHIAGAVLLPDYELGSRAQTELPDKEATILVYCRSGRRSQNAAQKLAAMGYTDVRDFGGVIDWPYGLVRQ